MSRLGQATGPVSQLAARMASGIRGMDVDLGRLGKVHLQLLGHVDVQAVESATHKAMIALGMQLDVFNAQSYEAERAVRTLAIAARTIEDHAKPFGTLEEWQQIDSDMLVVCWQAYGDVREQLDPIPPMLTEDWCARIAGAIEKKNEAELRSCGVVRLSHYQLTMAARPATALTEK